MKIRSLFVKSDSILSSNYLDSLVKEVSLNDFLILDHSHNFKIQSISKILNLFTSDTKLNINSIHSLINDHNDVFWSLIYYFKSNMLPLDFLLRENHIIL